MAVSDKERQHFLRIEKLAKDDGIDRLEALERSGLLLTNDRRLELIRTVIAFLLVELESVTDTQLAELGGAQTVTGAVRGVTVFIELCAQRYQ